MPPGFRLAIRLGIVTATALACAAWPLAGHAQTESAGKSAALRDYLESRVAENPGDTSSWRMLGRVCAQRGDTARASEALDKALQLDPLNVAAHFDYGELLLNSQRTQEAANYFHKVETLAPDSDYARDARARLAYLPPPTEPEAALASYEINRFDGTDRVEPLSALNLPSSLSPPLSARIEGGGLYNTNAALTPTSRSFFSGQAAGFQGFVNPDLEYRIVNGADWRAGPRFTGYFNLNEASFRNLNLQSYQPAVFVERSIPLAGTVLVPRLQYVFTHDEFQGVTFANRHALAASVASYLDDGDLSLAYLSGDYTNFADDGGDPAHSSRDGYTVVAGASHTRLLALQRLRSVTYGCDLQYTDTVGSNFTFAGVSLYGEVEVPLASSWSLFFDGSWGYRDYFRSDLVPTRNENVWRGGARLRKTINQNWSVVGVFTYNRFDSANTFFQTDRTLAGVVTVFEY